MKSNSKDHVELWKYDWLDWCKFIEDPHQNLQALDTCISIYILVDEISQFERQICEFRRSLSLEEALRSLEDRRDEELTKKLNAVRTNKTLMQNLEDLWADTNLMKIHALKSAASARLWSIMFNTLEVMVGDFFHKHMCEYQTIEVYTFICLRQLREANPHHRSIWKELYRRIEEIKANPILEYRNSLQESEWLKRFNENFFS
jgi:hypothetical protein